jgi:TPR repeat protein
MTESHSGTDEHDIANALFEEGEYKEALERYRILAQGGSVNAQLRIGWMYHAGRGVDQDLDEAYRWYQKAADANSPAGQFYLGTLYRTQKQYQQAIEWVEKSALQGYPPAMYRLGKMYDWGEGIAADKDKAYRYFEQAAKQGHLMAQRQIAARMLKGERGILRIPQGLYLFARVLWTGIKLGLNDPDSDKIRW